MLNTKALMSTIDYLREHTPRESIPVNSKVIELIDPGHGGIINDVYTTYPRKMYNHGPKAYEVGNPMVFYEGVWTRAIAWLYAADLYANGLGYYIVAPGHTDYGRTERCIRANHFNAKVKKKGIRTYYHSIHGNGYGVESVNGIEVYTSPGQTLSDPIATEMYYKLEELLGWRMRPGLGDGDPDKEAKFTVLVRTHMPAVLSEVGFYTNFEECVNMLSLSNMSLIIQAFRETHEIVIHKDLLKPMV